MIDIMPGAFYVIIFGRLPPFITKGDPLNLQMERMPRESTVKPKE